MARLPANQVSDRWAQGFGSSSDRYKAGVQAVTQSPTEKAAAQLGVAKQNYAQAVDSGRMADRLRSVTLEQWKSVTADTGAMRLTSGADKGKTKYQKFASAFLPQLYSAADSLPNRGTFEQNKARMNTMVDKTHALKGKW